MRRVRSFRWVGPVVLTEADLLSLRDAICRFFPESSVTIGVETLRGDVVDGLTWDDLPEFYAEGLREVTVHIDNKSVSGSIHMRSLAPGASLHAHGQDLPDVHACMDQLVRIMRPYRRPWRRVIHDLWISFPMTVAIYATPFILERTFHLSRPLFLVLSGASLLLGVSIFFIWPSIFPAADLLPERRRSLVRPVRSFLGWILPILLSSLFGAMASRLFEHFP